MPLKQKYHKKKFYLVRKNYYIDFRNEELVCYFIMDVSIKFQSKESTIITVKLHHPA